MSEGFAISSVELGLLIGRGVVIVALLRLLAYLLELAPIRRRRKELLRAVGPLFAVAVCVAYVVSAVQQIFGGYAAAMPLMLGAVLVGCAAALWPPIRDLLAGVFLRTGNVIGVGDELQVGEIRGRVERLGYRRLILRTAGGEAIVPYGTVSRSALVRGSRRHATATHTFRVRPIPGVPQVELRRLIHDSALLCHWTSLSREPELVNAEQGAIDVTVFAVASEYASEIESAVRKRLSRVEHAQTTEGLGSVTAIPGGRSDGGGGGVRQPK